MTDIAETPACGQHHRGRARRHQPAVARCPRGSATVEGRCNQTTGCTSLGPASGLPASSSAPGPGAAALLAQLRASWTALGEDEEQDDDENDWSAAPPDPGQRGMDLHTVLAAHSASGGAPPSMSEIIKLMMLKEMSAKRTSRSEEGGGKPSGIARAVSKMHQHRDDLKSKPKTFIKESRELVKDELGVKDGEVWSYYEDVAKKIPWGKMKSLQRCFLLDCALMELLERGEANRAQALLGQGLQQKTKSTLRLTTEGSDDGIEDPDDAKKKGAKKGWKKGDKKEETA